MRPPVFAGVQAGRNAGRGLELRSGPGQRVGMLPAECDLRAAATTTAATTPVPAVPVPPRTVPFGGSAGRPIAHSLPGPGPADRVPAVAARTWPQVPSAGH